MVWKYDEIDWTEGEFSYMGPTGEDYLDSREKITIDEDFVVRDYHVNKKYGLAKFGEVGSMVVNEDLTILDENGELYRDYYREKKMATGTKKTIKIKNFSVRKNSGGKGKFNGGNGTIREIEFLQKMTAVILSNRRKIKPFGIKGAQPGLTGKNLLFKNNELKPIKLNSCETILVKKGDIITIKTPGGGGYGKKATV